MQQHSNMATGRRGKKKMSSIIVRQKWRNQNLSEPVFLIQISQVLAYSAFPKNQQISLGMKKSWNEKIKKSGNE